MVKIFVSYSRVDSDVMKKFAELLGYGCDVWFDTAGIIGGEDWWKRIITEIEQCEHFVYLLSPESASSEWCVKELDKAIELGKHIIPIRIRARTNLPEKIKDIQVIEAYGDYLTDGISRVYGAILKGIKIETKQELTEAHRQADLRLLEKYWKVVSIHELRWLIYKLDDNDYDNSFESSPYSQFKKQDLYFLWRHPETTFHDNRLNDIYGEIDGLMTLVENYDDSLEQAKTIEAEAERIIDNFVALLKANYPEQPLF